MVRLSSDWLTPSGISHGAAITRLGPNAFRIEMPHRRCPAKVLVLHFPLVRALGEWKKSPSLNLTNIVDARHHVEMLARCAVPSNEKADEMNWPWLGKPFLSPHQVQSFKEAKAFLKQLIKIKEREENESYKPELGSIGDLDRNMQSRIVRCETGHCKSRAHIH